MNCVVRKTDLSIQQILHQRIRAGEGFSVMGFRLAACLNAGRIVPGDLESHAVVYTLDHAIREHIPYSGIFYVRNIAFILRERVINVLESMPASVAVIPAM